MNSALRSLPSLVPRSAGTRSTLIGGTASPRRMSGERVGDVAEEAGELVGGTRVDRTQLDLAADGVAGRGEAAMAAGLSRASSDGRFVQLVPVVAHEIVAHEGERLGLGVHGEKRRLLRRGGVGRADRREGQIGLDIKGWKRFAEADPGGEYGRPHDRKRVLAPALDRGPNRRLHPTPSFQLANENERLTARGPHDRGRCTLRCTLERRAAYWAACTSTTSGT